MEWEEIAVFLTLGAIGLSLLILVVAAWLGNKKNLEGRLMIIGSTMAVPGAGVWLFLANWGPSAELFQWSRSLETQAIITVLLAGIGSALFSVGLMIYRFNRPELPEGPAPYIPQGPERVER